MAREDPSKTYDELWQSSWHAELQSPGASYRTRRRLFLRLIDKVYTPGASIVDVGCGNGSLIADIAARHPDAGVLMGIDVAEAAVEHARRTMPNGVFMQCDPQNDPLPISQPADIVTACEVLEHVPDYERVLRHIVQALRPGGYAIISVPHGMRFWGPHDKAVFHVRRFEHDELRSALTDAGLNIVESFTWGSVFYRMYYAAVLNRVAPQSTAESKGRLMRFAHQALYRALYLDDFFLSKHRGRMLFAIAQKPR